MSYEPLHHKYRPKTFAALVGQDAIATTLRNAIRTSKIAPAYLFTGPRGTGKTSSARILAKSLNCLKSDKPTEQPCGVCEACLGIANGYALDVIEIDAASNTGVDHIRELIERAQFAPVQCRYKVYVIDECLTGESLVQTADGPIRIDNPNINGKKVLSYNDSSGAWEFKKVVRWLDQGERQTVVIKTNNCEIKCTGNHLIKTEQGWIAAKDIKAGDQILSPRNAAATSLTNLVQIQEPDAGRRVLLIHSQQWITSFEIVESVKVGGIERVYDIEVQSNHNFVANGLLVHNCHMLSTAAFNALLKTLEEPPSQVVFVLATTDPQRVLPTIISRCQRFDYRRIPLEAMVSHLKHIAAIENINITQEALQLVAQVSQGGLRDAESLLDQLSLLSSQVTIERVWDLVGSCSEPDLIELLEAIATNNPEAVLELARKVMDRGREPLTVLQNLAGFYRDLLIAKTAPNRNDLVAITPSTWKALCEAAKRWEVGNILAGQQHLAKSEVQIKNTTQPSLWLELILLGLLPIPATTSDLQTQETQPEPAAIAVPASQHGKSFAESSEPLLPAVASQEVAPQLPAPTADSNPAPAVEPTPFAETDTIWQQVIDHLQPLATQALLRQQCRLLAFDGAVALIGINSQPLLKLAQSKLPNIEAAFEKLLQQKVKVSLEVASTQPNHTPGNTPQRSKVAREQGSRKDHYLNSSSEVIPVGESPAPIIESTLPKEDIATYAPTTANWDEDEVAIAAQRLATCFNGEVISLDLDSAFTQLVTTSLPPQTASEWDNTDAEDDIDF